MNKGVLTSIVLAMFILAGCSYVYEGKTASCDPPGVARTDINGNTVCVIEPEDGKSAEEVLEEMQDEMADEPVDEEPANEPMDEEPADEEPMDEEPMDEEPMDEEPMDEEPMDEEPMDEEPADEEPMDEEPVDEEPMDEEPAEEFPAEGLPRKEVTEGDLVSFPNLKAVDPDGDPLEYTFSEPLDENGEWQTAEGDAGEYVITITVSDGENVVSQDLLLVVGVANAAPILADIDDMEVFEGDLVQVEASAEDADGDELAITFGEPLAEDGTWQTEIGDAGEYQVDVTASDGALSDTVSFIISVMAGNRPPVMESIGEITVTEGETVTLDVVVEDPEGDDVTVTISGWMDSTEYTTTFDDAGTHLVTITATDGQHDVTQEVRIVVEDVNRAPVFEGDWWN